MNAFAVVRPPGKCFYNLINCLLLMAITSMNQLFKLTTFKLFVKDTMLNINKQWVSVSLTQLLLQLAF